MSVVLDSSIVLAWYFKDEQTAAVLAVLDEVVAEGAIVPPIWRYEVANGLQMAVIRRRVDSAFRDNALSRLARLSILTDSECDAHAWSASVQLADRHGLTTYDASYLELAQRRRTRLATLDRKMIDAAWTNRIPTIGS